MKSVIGPYEIGDQVAAGPHWVLHAGRDTDGGAPIWARRVDPAPRRASAARGVLRELAGCDRLSAPVALAGDDGALVAIDRVEPDRTVLARAGRLDGDRQVRLAHDLAVAIEAMHAAGYAHGGLDAWTVDVAEDGAAWVRGSAEAVGALDRPGARRDVCAVAATIELAGGGEVDARLAETLTAMIAGRVGLAALIARAAAILDPPSPSPSPPPSPSTSPSPHASVGTPSRPAGDTPLRRLAPTGLAARAPLPAAARARRSAVGGRRAAHAPRRARRSAVGGNGAAHAPRRARRSAVGGNGAAHAPRHAAEQRAEGATVTAIALLVAGALLAALALWPRASDPRQPMVPAASFTAHAGSPAEPQWASYLPALYATRAEAFAQNDVDMLRQVFTAGSAQLRADAETIAALSSQHRVVSGFTPSIVEVRDVAVTGSTATVHVIDQIPGFVIRDPAGADLPVVGRPPALTVLVLQAVDGAWLIDTAERTA